MLNERQRRIWWYLAALGGLVLTLAASIVILRVQHARNLESIVRSYGGEVRWGVGARFPDWARTVLPDSVENAFFGHPTVDFGSRGSGYTGSLRERSNEVWLELHERLSAHRDRIVCLRFPDTEVGDQIIGTFCEYPTLWVLDLCGTRVTDEGLAELHNVESLTTILLDHTSITEEGLEALRRCRNLRNLSLVNTGLPESALMSLEADLPGLVISDD